MKTDYVFEVEREPDDTYWWITCEVGQDGVAIGKGLTLWTALADCIEDVLAVEARAGFRFRFTFTVQHSVDLDVTQIWPDGDAPRHPSVEDVQALVAENGGAAAVLEDWNLTLGDLEDDDDEEEEAVPEIVRLRIAKVASSKSLRRKE